MSNDELEFLQQSNYIEGVTDSKSFDYAVKAWRYLRNQDDLTQEIILHTHKILMKNQPIEKHLKGAYRDFDVRVGSRICPQYQLVPSLMWHWMFEAIRKSPPIDEIALHVKFEHIHPFIDGNGRVGRMLLNWMRIKKLSKPIMIIREEDRFDYYKWF